MRALPLGLPFQGRWLGAAETERLLQICGDLSVSLRLTAPLQGEPLDIKNAPCGCTERFLSYEPGRDQ